MHPSRRRSDLSRLKTRAQSNSWIRQTPPRRGGDFALAKGLLQAVRQMRPNDDYVVQQLALATYKSKQPEPKTALEEARTILKTLNPESTNDPETLGLWGAVHKRLWEITEERA